MALAPNVVLVLAAVSTVPSLLQPDPIGTFSAAKHRFAPGVEFSNS